MNYQNQQMFAGNTDGTPITLLRHDLDTQNGQYDNQSQYTVGSIETTSDIRNLVKEINNNIESKKTDKTNKIKKNDTDNNTDTDTDTDTKKSNKSDKSNKANKLKSNKLKSNKSKFNKSKSKKLKSKKSKSKKNQYNCNTWEDYLYDSILLFIIFMLMSQEFVKNSIGSKIKMINVNDKGVVPITGVAVYGFIFVVVFIVMKFLINKLILFI